jgi:hypothetical protein
MAFIFHVDPEFQITYLKIYQHCLLSDLAGVALSPMNAKRPKARLMLFDFLDGDLEIELEAMKTFSTFIKDLDQSGFEMEPTAILTNNKLVASFFESFDLMVNAKDELRKAFSTLDEALTWFGMLEHAQAIHQIRAQLLEQLRTEACQPQA